MTVILPCTTCAVVKLKAAECRTGNAECLISTNQRPPITGKLNINGNEIKKMKKDSKKIFINITIYYLLFLFFFLIQGRATANCQVFVRWRRYNNHFKNNNLYILRNITVINLHLWYFIHPFPGRT